MKPQQIGLNILKEKNIPQMFPFRKVFFEMPDTYSLVE